MVDVGPSDPTVVIVLATADVCDVVAMQATGVTACRVAPDELLLVGGGDLASGDVVASATKTASAADPHALVSDVTDGWSAWTIEGSDCRAAFARLSELRLPDRGFVQGEVARLPAKVLVEEQRLTLLVPAMWGEFLRERIVADCAALDVREVPA